MFLSENYNSPFRRLLKRRSEHGFQNALRRCQTPVEAHQTPWEYRDSPPVKESLYEALRRVYGDVSFREL